MVIYSEMSVPEAIRGAERGSLLYDCVEKLAYKLHLKNPERDADTNWFIAQDYLDYWIQTRFGSIVAPTVSKLVQTCLDSGVQSYQKEGIPVSDTRYKFAEAVVEACEHDGFLRFQHRTVA